MTAAPRIVGIDHVGIKATDMDRSLAFYRDRLGLAVLRRLAREGGLEVAVLAVGGGQEINLFARAGFDAPPGGDPVGLDHVCFAVDAPDGMDALVAALAARGAVSDRPPQTRRDGVSLFLSDPDGCRIELIVKTQAP
ncbi:MAG: VOC family protein [Alphaproteobacteria bacterium]|nr:VOC family protein [Alphaproteobacteria bacterium]